MTIPLSSRSGTIATLAWIDVTTFDLEAASEFHTGLFGWTREELAMDEAPGYSFYRSSGEVVAAIDPIPPEKGPPQWTVFVEVRDLDRMLGEIKRAGGKVILERAPILDHGILALVADPMGAEFGLWLADRMTPPRHQRLPGSLVGGQLRVPNTAVAAAFYLAVFNWTEEGTGAAERSLFLDAAGLPVELIASDGETGWTPWLGTEDVAATIFKAAEMGATVRRSDVGAPIVSWLDGSCFGVSRL